MAAGYGQQAPLTPNVQIPLNPKEMQLPSIDNYAVPGMLFTMPLSDYTEEHNFNILDQSGFTAAAGMLT